MVDATESAESPNVVVDLIKSSPTKKLVVLGEGEYQEYDQNGKKVRKLVMPVQVDKKAKNWIVNRPSSEAMIEAFGADTANWVGKTVPLKVIKDSRGQDMILALPEKDDIVEEEEIADEPATKKKK